MAYDNVSNPPAGGALILQQIGAPGSVNNSQPYTLTFDAMVNALNIDNVTLTQVPEPSAALLGGLGLIALLRRKR